MLSPVKSYCTAFLALFLLPLLAAATGGLRFHGSEQPINQRTSYSVFGDKAVEFSGKFNIEFNLSLYPTTEFGYILRIKNQDSNRIYHLFYDGQGGDLSFKLNEENRNNLIVANMSREKLQNLPWFKMEISFDLETDSITLTIADQSFTTGDQELPDTYRPIILFGKSDHIIDVPSFALKDLSVGNEEKYSFVLDESEGNAVHDISGEAIGKVLNPEWLINDAYHWRSLTSFKSLSVAGANYDAEKKKIYYFNSDSLYIYDVRSRNTEIRVFEEKSPVKLTLGTNFIDTKGDKLYAYEAYIEDYNGPTVASLDLNDYRWTTENSSQLASPLHHHGGYFDPAEERYTIFGGFGRMHYSKDFFSYDVNRNKWDSLPGCPGDFLSTRYFSSVGYSKGDNSVYIFGGMGNESGEQTVGRQYYYDLYRMDLATREISKLWEIEWKQDNMVPVRGMVIVNDSTFYTLCYPEHVSQSLLKLYRFSIKDGKYEILGDSIPIRSDKITTNANLYYDSALNKLFTVVQEFEDDIKSELKVYSLSFPPITADELASYSRNDGGNRFALILLLSTSLAIGIGYVLYRRFKAKKERLYVPVEHVPNTKHETPKRSNAIYLFGEFTVRDRKDRNITYMFSAQLKQIFCLILQYTTTEGGIASQRLSNILWPDKPADKVKNSRGVTLNHLRKALGELDGIELIYDKGFFKLEYNEKFYCDYTRCLEIISSNEEEKYRDELVEILSRGKFLQLSDHALYDSFKEEMEKKLEPVLILEMEKSFNAEQYQTTLVFSEAIANIDPLNETALAFQIKAMQRLKMNDEARIRYAAFVIEYKKAMGDEYPHAYKNP